MGYSPHAHRRLAQEMGTTRENAMPFVPFNNVIKLEAIFTLDGQRVQNVHHYLVDETPDVDTCEELAISYRSWWLDAPRNDVSSSLALTMIKCTIMETEFSPGIEYVTGLPLSGNVASPHLPNNVTLAVKWGTGLRGRSFRGRTYHLGLCESQVTGSRVNSESIPPMLGYYGDLITLATDVGPAVMCIASRFQGGLERTVGVATPVISVSIDSVIDSQRRRLPGRGL